MHICISMGMSMNMSAVMSRSKSMIMSASGVVNRGMSKKGHEDGHEQEHTEAHNLPGLQELHVGHDGPPVATAPEAAGPVAYVESCLSFRKHCSNFSCSKVCPGLASFY